jgi:hypothetical protein
LNHFSTWQRRGPGQVAADVSIAELVDARDDFITAVKRWPRDAT